MMREIFLIIGSISLCCANTELLAQAPATSATDVSIAQIVFAVPKPGAVEKYEQGIKRHIAWRKANHDTWAWQTWEVVTGKDAGSYITGTFGHRWEEFDDREQFNVADRADFADV